jgi:hypothetical protein
MYVQFSQIFTALLVHSLVVLTIGCAVFATFFYSLRSESNRIWILFASKYLHKFACNIHFLIVANICLKIFVLKRIFAKLKVNFTFKRIFAKYCFKLYRKGFYKSKVSINTRFLKIFASFCLKISALKRIK